MADAGVIHYNQARGTIELAENADQLVRFLPYRVTEKSAAGSSRRAVTLAALGGGLLVALQALHPEPWLSGIVVGTLFVLWFLIS